LIVSVAGRRLFGLAVSVVIVGAAIAACRPNGDVGYVEIKTVPAAPVTLTALYIDTTKLSRRSGREARFCGSRPARLSCKPTAPPERWRRCAKSLCRATASPR
jgi:hypothetical protein